MALRYVMPAAYRPAYRPACLAACLAGGRTPCKRHNRVSSDDAGADDEPGAFQYTDEFCLRRGGTRQLSE